MRAVYNRPHICCLYVLYIAIWQIQATKERCLDNSHIGKETPTKKGSKIYGIYKSVA